MTPSRTPRVSDSESAAQSDLGNDRACQREQAGVRRRRWTPEGGHSELCLGADSGGQRAVVEPIMRFVMLLEGHGHFRAETRPIMCGLCLQPGHLCVGRMGSGKTGSLFQGRLHTLIHPPIRSVRRSVPLLLWPFVRETLRRSGSTYPDCVLTWCRGQRKEAGPSLVWRLSPSGDGWRHTQPGTTQCDHGCGREQPRTV